MYFISFRAAWRPALALLLLFALPLLAVAASLLTNDGLEPPFNKYGSWSAEGRTFDLEVAHGWERFFIPAGTDDDDKLRYFRASSVAFLYGGYTEKRDGSESQLFWSTRPFDAGIYQQIFGLTPGESYGFQAGMLQVYGSTRSKTHGKMFRSVGIDPTGGVDPAASTVVWGPEEGLDVDWFYPGVGATAQGQTMTVFVRVRSIDDAPTFEENLVWVDDTFFDVAPVTTLNLVLTSPTEVTAAWSGAPRSGFSLFAYEAQYRRTTDSAWTDLQIFTSDEGAAPPSTNSSRSFTVQPGQSYIVRARTWHQQSGGDSHEIPGPWVEQSIVAGGLIEGRVLNNQSQGVSSAEVSVAGQPALKTTTIAGGDYQLLTGPGVFTLTARSGVWHSGPVGVTVPSVVGSIPLTLTLRPPDDVLQNGSFEEDLTGWQSAGAAPQLQVTTAQRYDGVASLRLSDTVVVSQSSVLSGSYRPTLSFWYRLSGGDGDDRFTAQLLADDESAAAQLTPTAVYSSTTAGGWRFISLPLALTEVYSGPVAVRFSLTRSGPVGAVIYLDSVSLGKAPDGPFRTFLPVLLKKFRPDPVKVE